MDIKYTATFPSLQGNLEIMKECHAEQDIYQSFNFFLVRYATVRILYAQIYKKICANIHVRNNVLYLLKILCVFYGT